MQHPAKRDGRLQGFATVVPSLHYNYYRKHHLSEVYRVIQEESALLWEMIV